MRSRKVCRICLTNLTQAISLYNNFDLRVKLMACASIEIDTSDSLPSTICVNCNVRLNEAYEFRELARNSDVLLKTNLYKHYSHSTNTPTSTADSRLNVGSFCAFYIKEEDGNSDVSREENLTSLLSESNEETSCNDKRGTTLIDQQIKTENDHESSSEEDSKPVECINVKKVQLGNECKKINKEHSNSKEKIKGICSTCGKIITKTCDFQRHLESHSKEKSHVCDTCGKRYKSKSGLSTHVQMHRENTNYPCKICGKNFKHRSARNRHLKVHAGIKVHNCNFCEKKFTDRTLLHKHLRVHTGEQPFKCEFCDRGFTQKWNLDQHTRLHTNTKPYKCSQCNCAFRHNVTLKSHIKSKHSSVTE